MTQNAVKTLEVVAPHVISYENSNDPGRETEYMSIIRPDVDADAYDLCCSCPHSQGPGGVPRCGVVASLTALVGHFGLTLVTMECAHRVKLDSLFASQDEAPAPAPNPGSKAGGGDDGMTLDPPAPEPKKKDKQKTDSESAAKKQETKAPEVDVDDLDDLFDDDNAKPAPQQASGGEQNDDLGLGDLDLGDIGDLET